MIRRSVLPVLFACLVLAGCLGFPPGDAETTDSPVSETTETTPRPAVETPPPTDCGDLGVSFYGIGGGAQSRMWDHDVVRIGYTLPTDASVFFVAYEGGTHENGTVLGVERDWNDGDYPVAADGAPVELDAPLSGERTISVIAHADADGNGEFDRGEDPACLNDGELVRAGPSTFDFDEFGNETTIDG